MTEDEGRLLKVFPGSETLRYTIPFQEPHATYEFLRGLAARRPGSTVVCADDGEKFGSWPETYDHVYKRGWLTRFCDMLVGNRDWLETTTLGRTVDATLPLGKVYIPDGSYREMTEWVLPPGDHHEYDKAGRLVRSHDQSHQITPFFRAGGFWRNFKARLSRERRDVRANAGPLQASGGRRRSSRRRSRLPRRRPPRVVPGPVQLPVLARRVRRSVPAAPAGAIFRALIACHNAIDEAEGKDGPRVELEVGDFNLDARQEARLENDRLIAFGRPAQGGQLYELDVRQAGVNVLSTLDRRPEVYHQTILDTIRTRGAVEHGDAPASIHDRVVFKQDNLDDLIVYDRHPRKAFVDHFYPPDVRLDDLIAARDVERGDFVAGAYMAKAHRERDRVALVMERPGWADGHSIRVRKTIELAAGSTALEVRYELEGLPADARLHFAVEINLAGMAGHADDRYYSNLDGDKLGMLDARIDEPHLSGLNLADEWLDLAVGLSWTKPGGLWCFPIETVSQSEGGFEGVYQSSAVVPHWHVAADESGRWEVAIQLSVDSFKPVASAADSLRSSLAEV